MVEQNSYLTIGEAAHLLRISDAALRVRMRRHPGDFYPYRYGRRIYLRRQDIEALIKRAAIQ